MRPGQVPLLALGRPSVAESVSGILWRMRSRYSTILQLSIVFIPSTVPVVGTWDGLFGAGDPGVDTS